MKELKYDIKRGADTYHAILGCRLQGWISSGRIKQGEVLVWRSGLSGWRKAEELEELAPFFKEQEGKPGKVVLGRQNKRRYASGQKAIKKILIVDDEKDLCWLLSDALEQKGYEVTNAHSKRKALASLKEAIPDMVILDLKLPDGDGMGLISKIRQAGPKIVICIASAYGSIKRKEEAKQKGAFNFIDKPFNIEDILKNIG